MSSKKCAACSPGGSSRGGPACEKCLTSRSPLIDKYTYEDTNWEGEHKTVCNECLTEDVWVNYIGLCMDCADKQPKVFRWMKLCDSCYDDMPTACPKCRRVVDVVLPEEAVCLSCAIDAEPSTSSERSPTVLHTCKECDETKFIYKDGFCTACFFGKKLDPSRIKLSLHSCATCENLIPKDKVWCVSCKKKLITCDRCKDVFVAKGKETTCENCMERSIIGDHFALCSRCNKQYVENPRDICADCKEEAEYEY